MSWRSTVKGISSLRWNCTLRGLPPFGQMTVIEHSPVAMVTSISTLSWSFVKQSVSCRSDSTLNF